MAARIALPLRVVLVAPPPGVRYGIQRGRGSGYDVEFVQEPKRGDVTFDFTIAVARGKTGQPNFAGEYVQGPPGRRFIYVDVGRYARQTGTAWARRMIVRLDDVTWPMIEGAIAPGKRLGIRVPGTAGDGGPNCATVNPAGGWKIIAG